MLLRSSSGRKELLCVVLFELIEPLQVEWGIKTDQDSQHGS